jgi:hypothetical protein
VCCTVLIFARVRANWCKGGGVSLGPGADHAQMFCGAVGVLWCARTAPAAPPRRGMLVRHVAGCCCGPDFSGKGWFPSSGVPRTRECRVQPRDDWCRWVGWWMDSGAPRSHGPLRGLGEKARVVPCQSPDFFRVFGKGGCFHRPGCRALTSVAVVTEMIGAGGWPVVCRDLTARCGAR